MCARMDTGVGREGKTVVKNSPRDRLHSCNDIRALRRLHYRIEALIQSIHPRRRSAIHGATNFSALPIGLDHIAFKLAFRGGIIYRSDAPAAFEAPTPIRPQR